MANDIDQKQKDMGGGYMNAPKLCRWALKKPESIKYYK